MAHPRASLLGLPSELRTSIYDHVIQLSPDPCPLELDQEPKRPRQPQGISTSYPTINETLPPTPSHLPWIRLILTCRAIAAELSSHMRSEAFLRNQNNRTYILDLTPTKTSQQPDKDTTTRVALIWRQVPCPLHQIKRLHLNIGTSPRTTIQALNLFLKHGLRMDRSKHLPHHLSIPELSMEISPRDVAGRPSLDERHRGLESARRVFGQFVHLEGFTAFFDRITATYCGHSAGIEVVHPAGQERGWRAWGLDGQGG